MFSYLRCFANACLVTLLCVDVNYDRSASIVRERKKVETQSNAAYGVIQSAREDPDPEYEIIQPRRVTTSGL